MNLERFGEFGKLVSEKTTCAAAYVIQATAQETKIGKKHTVGRGSCFSGRGLSG